MTSLSTRLKASAAATDAYLGQLFDKPIDVPERLISAMRHAVMGGGKRFRPFLVLETASLFGVSQEKALTTAGALECVHCYSLVHDDLPAMDNDLVRRGQPTVWSAYDDWTAILAGDALLTLSFELIAGPDTHPNTQVRNELVVCMAQAAGPAGMVGGQTYDLMSDKLGQPSEVTLSGVRRLQAMKTGALIRFACEAGAILGEADAHHRATLRSFGSHLGIVFQIADDLLDVTGDSETVGKATGKDADAGKATQVSLLGINGARSYLNDTVDAALEDLDQIDADTSVLAEAVRFAASRSS